MVKVKTGNGTQQKLPDIQREKPKGEEREPPLFQKGRQGNQDNMRNPKRIRK
jgi:hypothetical protein